MSEEATIRRAHEFFAKAFPDSGDEGIVAGVAPGRVNLIGEHTDYNDGFVLPLALDKVTVVVGKKRASSAKEARVACEAFADDDTVAFAVDRESLVPGDVSWASYVIGMVAQYVRHDVAVPPFDAVVVSDVPMGGGVSSSAALEMSTATFLEALTGHPVDKKVRARWGQACEHEFAKVPCGIMDQLISSCGVADHALLIDCRSSETVPVKLDDPSVCVLVTNSNVKHKLSGSEYPERRKQCHDAAAAMNIPALRDATREMLLEAKDKLDDVTYRRAYHVVTEDGRVQKAVEALRAGDYKTTGQRMLESHESLRDDFEVSTPEIDTLVEIAMGSEGVYGSRITGGGFGGCTVTLVESTAVEAVTSKIKELYLEKTGKEATCFVTRAGQGAHIASREL